jgi:hypothetical protein
MDLLLFKYFTCRFSREGVAFFAFWTGAICSGRPGLTHDGWLSYLNFLPLFLKNSAPRTTRKAVGMVARIRKISRSLVARAKAVTIPKIPTAKKYHPNPFMLFSIVFLDVLRSKSGWLRSALVRAA